MQQGPADVADESSGGQHPEKVVLVVARTCSWNSRGLGGARPKEGAQAQTIRGGRRSLTMTWFEVQKHQVIAQRGRSLG